MEIYTSAIEAAAASWSFITSNVADYDIVAGRLLFQNIFGLAPHAIKLYRFGRGYRPIYPDNNGDSKGPIVPTLPEEMYENPVFKMHASLVVSTLETTIKLMIGDQGDFIKQQNNLKALGDALDELGAKHAGYGVQSAHYGIVETALLRTLQAALPPHIWTSEVKRGWAAVIRFLTKGMKAGAEVDTKLTIVRCVDKENNTFFRGSACSKGGDVADSDDDDSWVSGEDGDDEVTLASQATLKLEITRRMPRSDTSESTVTCASDILKNIEKSSDKLKKNKIRKKERSRSRQQRSSSSSVSSSSKKKKASSRKIGKSSSSSNSSVSSYSSQSDCPPGNGRRKKKLSKKEILRKHLEEEEARHRQMIELLKQQLDSGSDDGSGSDSVDGSGSDSVEDRDSGGGDSAEDSGGGGDSSIVSESSVSASSRNQGRWSGSCSEAPVTPIHLPRRPRSESSGSSEGHDRWVSCSEESKYGNEVRRESSFHTALSIPTRPSLTPPDSLVSDAAPSLPRRCYSPSPSKGVKTGVNMALAISSIAVITLDEKHNVSDNTSVASSLSNG